MAALKSSGKNFASLPATPWDEAARRAEMDGVSVTMEVLSAPHLYAVDAAQLGDVCRITNDAFAELARAHPTRYRAFAHLPVHDTDAALEELRRAADDLNVAGAILTSNVHGRYLDVPELEPLWAEINRRGLTVFIHPIDSPCYHDDERPPILSWPFDTTLSVSKLITRGLFDRYPDIKLLVSHLGGTLPFLGHRLDLGFDPGNKAWTVKNPPSTYIAKLYVDTALGWSLPSFTCAREQVGREHMLFGTDHFNSQLPHLKRICAFVDALELTGEDRALLYEGNARRILRLTDA